MASAQVRFGGIDRLYGQGALAILSRARVAVIGVGGVGSWAAEALVRSGLGQITLIDGDEVCLSNTNRQSMALDGQFGRLKVEVLGERLRAIHPGMQVDAVPRFLTPSNLSEMLGAGFDYVLDACDALRVKVDAIYWCRRNRVPILTVGSAGGRTDPRALVVRDLAKTDTDPLLARVRHKLRDEFGWTRNPRRYFGVPAVFSSQQPVYPQANGALTRCKPRPLAEAARLDCGGGLGAAMHVTASFAMVAAGELLSRLIGIGRGERPR